ncbi:MAG TPA: low affinity iron permease family protein [Dehalococcoidia bacterium]|nr:low affinity iron permease family protein [Dehalococcoidia bacterium]
MRQTRQQTPEQAGTFERIADFMSFAIGTPAAFAAAVAIVVAWAALGPSAGFSNTWQLVINTGTTIVTFLMVFLLGNASNRITESQDRMLAGIYDEERRLEHEERLIQRLLQRIDVEHIRPILRHLDQQDHQIEQMERRILERLTASGPGA